MSEDSMLIAVLDTLLPPHDELPGAGNMGLAVRVREEAAQDTANADVLDWVLTNLPTDFVRLDAAAREEALRAIESSDQARFFGLVVTAYNVYYTDPRVQQWIERKTGYAARPPQPLGYELKPFDESLLAKVRQREPFYRKV